MGVKIKFPHINFCIDEQKKLKQQNLKIEDFLSERLLFLNEQFSYVT